MFGISTVNIELTSRCNKDCWMCGRRRQEKLDPDYFATLGNMPLWMVHKIADQLDPGTVVQLHWNGEPTLYPNLHEASKILDIAGMYVCMDTNGLALHEHKLDFFWSVTVSVVQGDSEENYAQQLRNIKWLCDIFHGKINIRELGSVPAMVYPDRADVIKRILHAPEMSRDYEKEVTKPEIGVCLDLLHHPAIDRKGNVYPCVRFNPEGKNLLGNVDDKPLSEIFTCDRRLEMIRLHFAGRRHDVDLCNQCDYYGIPRG